MRVSEIEVGKGALEMVDAWGFCPMQCLLELLDDNIEEIEGCGADPKRVGRVAGKLLNIKYILENQLRDVRDSLSKYNFDYVIPMERRLEELENRNKGMVHNEN